MKKLTKAQIRKIKKTLPRVQNFTSAAGNDIANQFLIFTADGTFFQSYSTVIAYKPYTGKIILDGNRWDYSVTTGKYRNLFLNEGIADTRANIESGKYQLADLN